MNLLSWIWCIGVVLAVMSSFLLYKTANDAKAMGAVRFEIPRILFFLICISSFMPVLQYVSTIWCIASYLDFNEWAGRKTKLNAILEWFIDPIGKNAVDKNTDTK